MLLRGSIRFLLASESNWGYHVWIRFAQYSNAKSAKAAIKVLARNGWSTDTAYPSNDYQVCSVKKWPGAAFHNPRIRYPRSKK